MRPSARGEAREANGESPRAGGLSPRAAAADEELSNLPRIDVPFEGSSSRRFIDARNPPSITIKTNSNTSVCLVKYPRRLRCTVLSYRRSAVSAKVLSMSEATKADLQDGGSGG